MILFRDIGYSKIKHTSSVIKNATRNISANKSGHDKCVINCKIVERKFCVEQNISRLRQCLMQYFCKEETSIQKAGT